MRENYDSYLPPFTPGSVIIYCSFSSIRVIFNLSNIFRFSCMHLVSVSVKALNRYAGLAFLFPLIIFWMFFYACWFTVFLSVDVANRYLVRFELSNIFRCSCMLVWYTVFVSVKVVNGYGLSRVVASNDVGFEEGDLVAGFTSWEEYTFMENTTPLRKIQLDEKIPISYHIGLLGEATLNMLGLNSPLVLKTLRPYI